jgi:diamine N-acetyltransferase
MNLKLVDVTETNFWDVIKLKSDEDQVKRIQIFERWVGSNTFFLAASFAYGFTPRAIYDGEELVGFASHGFNRETGRYEMVSIMIGYQYQGKGYGVPALKLVIDEMVHM